ncbi:hypothetical protein VFPPC_12241 [Pochonia chlamydosporia 170]|uniref:Uncharacterized protein n=1 Tax=Pochonia chlamydosporia 170 TaxID=1380566 RepID=A0A179EYM8_METCM|nr:hypothetical protein VFPPC_12241 [Pochonia chlamydosporia 170]OAQ58278.1 hypothetical protein VFPPC_12241 [Pochonia chlamydosporia 170]
MSNLSAEQFGYNNQHDTTPPDIYNAMEPLVSTATPPPGHFGDEYQLLQQNTYYGHHQDGSQQQTVGMDFVPPEYLDPSDNVQSYPPDIGGEASAPSHPSISPQPFYQNQQATKQIQQQPTELLGFPPNNIGHSQFLLEAAKLMTAMQSTRDEGLRKAFLDGQRSNQALVDSSMGMLNAITNWSRLQILKEDSAKFQFPEHLLRYGEAQYATASEEDVPGQ